MLTAERIAEIFKSKGDEYVDAIGSGIVLDGEWSADDLIAIARSIVQESDSAP